MYTEVKVDGEWREIHDMWGSKVSYYCSINGAVTILQSEAEDFR